MSDESKSTAPTGKIEFIENHRPALPSGDYEITVSQSIKATREIAPTGSDGGAKKEPVELFNNLASPFQSQTRKFCVLGPRFALEPQVIRAVFPPAGSLGEHSNVLPHISFNRSTLPWERLAMPLTDEESKALEKRAKERTVDEAADTPKLKTPWLALLLLDQDELVEKTPAKGDKDKLGEGELTAGKVSGPKACTLVRTGDSWTLKPSPQVTDPEGVLSPEFPHESGQQDGDPVTVIDVACDLLKAILPSLEDVQLMGHVRQPTDESRTPLGDQVATLLANRLPQPDEMSVVHLVSLEGLYGSEKYDIWKLLEVLYGSEKKDISKLPDAKFVRLVSLKSWRFTCLDEKHSFKGLLSNLHRSPSTLQLPSDRLKSAAPFLKRGCVPVPHEMRQGNRSVSWYRGPLAPGRVDQAKEDGKESSERSLRARSADQLVRYNPANGMFDVSYAAAWELGRLLTLQNDKAAVSLLDWKRRHRHDQERQRAMQELEHLPVAGRPVATDLPADVTQWFADLALLKGVPFNYLVPDERMLPQESIRFFWVDPEWIRCLHDGAFSIGRVLPSDHKRDAAHDQDLLASPHEIVTGFLLRSAVVSGWPDLLVEGYDEAVTHEDYEHDTLPPEPPLTERITFDRSLQEAMNNGDTSLLCSQFGFVHVSDIAVSPIKADSRWLVNVNKNETLYLVERIGENFRLSIENKLPMLRMERLSPNVLLCIFAGDIKTVDIHQKPEALHFGVSLPEDPSGSYFKELKSHVGGELPGCDVKFGPLGKNLPVCEGHIPWKDAERRVISMQDLNGTIQRKLKEFGGIEQDPGKFPSADLRKVAIAINSVGENGAPTFFKAFKKAAESATSAQFALQMTEGVQKVRFVKG